MTSLTSQTRPDRTGPTDDGQALPEPDLSACEPVAVDLDQIHLGEGVRVDGTDAAHVRTLADSPLPLPPVILHRPSMRVVDGVHRVLAARQRGDSRIPAVFVDGSDIEAFVLAVRLNSRHGLPLNRKDRRAAVERIVSRHPEWSDRRIAVLAGVSPKTVASVRNCSTEEVPQMTARLGQDGRVRPVDTAEGRLQAAEELRRRPVASVREIAAVTGIAPGTVSDVRRRLQLGLDPVPLRSRRARAAADTREEPAPQVVAPQVVAPQVVEALVVAPQGAPQVVGPQERASRPEAARPALRIAAPSPDGRAPGAAAPLQGRDLVPADRSAAAGVKKLTADPALRLTLDGRFLLRLLHAHAEGLSDPSRLVRAVPPHRLDTVARLAREFADGWTQLAEALEHPDALHAAGAYGDGAARRDGTGGGRSR